MARPKLKIVQRGSPQPPQSLKPEINPEARPEARPEATPKPFNPYAAELPPLSPDPIDFSDLRAQIEVLFKFLDFSWSHPRIKAWMEATAKAANLRSANPHYLPYDAYEKLLKRLTEQQRRLRKTEALLSLLNIDWQHPKMLDYLKKAGATTKGGLSSRQIEELELALEMLLKQKVE